MMSDIKLNATQTFLQQNASSRESLKSQRDELRAKVTSLAQTYDAKKMQLNESETYTQLGALEQKLRQCESVNFHLRECKC